MEVTGRDSFAEPLGSGSNMLIQSQLYRRTLKSGRIVGALAELWWSRLAGDLTSQISHCGVVFLMR